MQCKMCSEHNKMTMLHLIQIWRTYRSTKQRLHYSEGHLSSHMSPEGVDIFS